MYEELKKLAENATPGPWGYDGSYVCPSRVEGGTTYVESWKSVADCHQPENTKFIAAANPSAVLAMIDESNRTACRLEVSEDTREVIRACLKTAEAEIDQLKAENEALRKAVDFAAETFGKITSSDGSGHADLALAVLRIAGPAMAKDPAQ